MFSEVTTATNAVNGCCWHDSWSTTCKYVPVIRRIRCGILWFDSEFQTLSLLDAFKPICVTGMVYSVTNLTSHSGGHFPPKLLLLHVPCSPLEFRLKCLLIKPTFLFGFRVATSFLRLFLFLSDQFQRYLLSSICDLFACGASGRRNERTDGLVWKEKLSNVYGKIEVKRFVSLVYLRLLFGLGWVSWAARLLCVERGS